MDYILPFFDVISYLPRWYIGAFLGCAFLLYYLREAVKQPVLACSSGKFRQFLEENVPILKEKYWPTLWCFESRAQTIFASLLRSKLLPDMAYRREILHLSDGGQVGLDWLEEGCSSNSPIIIILPGLTGASQADYVKCLVLSAKQLGLRTVVFNNRGMGGIQLKTPRTYCAANCEDLAEVVAHVKATNPNVPLAASGISMGGMILGNYLAKEGPAAKKVITAAMLISVPWNAKKGSESIEKPILNLLLNRHLCGGLCQTVVRMKEQLNGDFVDLEEVLKSRTIREFDSIFTVKQFGFKDVDEYYDKAAIHDKLHNIQVPLLCLSAADDPFQPYDAIPVEAANESQHVAIVITARGGHIGFLEGLFPAYEGQYMSRLFSQYFAAVFKDRSNSLKFLEDSD
ncbi:protein ABHD1 [Anabrus simplex]|uniref:protein ABHD1 n=1 Tax=Anabrus simplex TaxID=316456 RepID=UPI0034DDA097